MQLSIPDFVTLLGMKINSGKSTFANNTQKTKYPNKG